jgi:hypothetical protein
LIQLIFDFKLINKKTILVGLPSAHFVAMTVGRRQCRRAKDGQCLLIIYNLSNNITANVNSLHAERMPSNAVTAALASSNVKTFSRSGGSGRLRAAAESSVASSVRYQPTNYILCLFSI